MSWRKSSRGACASPRTSIPRMRRSSCRKGLVLRLLPRQVPRRRVHLLGLRRRATRPSTAPRRKRKKNSKKARLEEAKRQREAERQRQKDDPICKGNKWLQGLAKDITAATTAKAESTTSSLPGNIGAEFQELFSRHTLTGNHSRVLCVLRGFLCACFAGLRIYEHVSGAVFLGVDSEPARNIAQDSTIESFQEPD